MGVGNEKMAKEGTNIAKVFRFYPSVEADVRVHFGGREPFNTVLFLQDLPLSCPEHMAPSHNYSIGPYLLFGLLFS